MLIGGQAPAGAKEDGYAFALSSWWYLKNIRVRLMESSLWSVSLLEDYLRRLLGRKRVFIEADRLIFPAHERKWTTRLSAIARVSAMPCGAIPFINGGTAWKKNSQETFAAGYWVHTFDKLLPAEVYGEKHPEYYAYFNGKRHPGKASQWCLTNPDVF